MKRIKVVFMIQQLVCGGAEQALFDLICMMDKVKFDVSVFTLIGEGEWEKKFTDAGISVISVFYRRPRSQSITKFIEHQLRKIKIYRVIWTDSRKLLNLFFSEGADVVVSYSMWGDEKAALTYNAKHIKFVHGNVGKNEPYRKIILNAGKFLPEYQKIICVSNESCEAFKRVTGLNENVEMHFNPLNSENVLRMAKEPVDIPTDVPYICAVGRLAPEKGYDRLIRIHKQILDEGLPHRLVVVGDGPEKEKLLQVIQETETSESVILTGYQANPYPYMKNSRFLVCSSYTEGLPVIAMEALSLGVPIVSAVPSIGEVFGDECCGIITENDDESLKSGIKRMLDDKAFYLAAKQGAENRSGFFDGKRMVKEIENVFLELMEGK